MKGTLLKTRPAVVIGNSQLSCTVLTGGGHIALVQRTDSHISTDDASEDYGSPLCVTCESHYTPPNDFSKLVVPVTSSCKARDNGKKARWCTSCLRPVHCI